MRQADESFKKCVPNANALTAAMDDWQV